MKEGLNELHSLSWQKRKMHIHDEKIKAVLFALCILCNCINVIAQNTKYTGEYILTKEQRQSTHNYCKIDLKEDGRFILFSWCYWKLFKDVYA